MTFPGFSMNSLCQHVLPLRKLSVVSICHSFVIKTFKSFFTIVVKALFSILMAFIWFLFPLLKLDLILKSISLAFSKNQLLIYQVFLLPCIWILQFVLSLHLLPLLSCFLCFLVEKKNQFIYFPFVLLNSRSIYCNVLCVFLLSTKLPTPHKFLYLS